MIKNEFHANRSLGGQVHTYLIY